MSYSFCIDVLPSAKIPVRKVLRRTALPDLGFIEGKPPARFTEGCYHLYQRGASQRGIEIAREDGIVSTRIFTGSSLADYRLAFALTLALAQQVRATVIECEGDGPRSLEDFSAKFGDAWAEQHRATLHRMTAGMLTRESTGALELSGVRRDWAIGPRMKARLRPGEEGFGARFDAAFQQWNWIDETDVYMASTIVVSSDRGELRVLALPDACPAVVSVADVVCLKTFDGSLSVRFGDFVEALSDQGTWISEDALMVPYIAGGAWNGLIARCRPGALASLDEAVQ